MMRAKNHISSLLLALVAVLALTAPRASARVESEIAPPDKRRAAVEKAAAIAKQQKADALPPTLNLPFAPPGFDLTDAEEAAAAAAAAALANRGNPAAPAPPTDHQVFVEIVDKIRPSGSFMMGGKPLLSFGNKFVKTGSHFTVTYKGTDYDLELTQIDGTNFTLRYKSEEITRPIKTGKSQ
jgi:hypothetical protein